MNNNYETTHKGIAAYLLMQGHNIVDITAGINKKNGRPNSKIEFDCDRSTGRRLGDEFFDNHIEGDLKDFYDKCNEVGSKIWASRNTQVPAEPTE